MTMKQPKIDKLLALLLSDCEAEDELTNQPELKCGFELSY